jgi:hypothetical protein
VSKSKKTTDAPPSNPLSDVIAQTDTVEVEIKTERIQPAPKPAEYPSVSQLGLPDHFPERIDLRPYTPELGETYEHAVSAALVAAFARKGTPLPFTPSPEHLAAIGGTDGINRYGVRELGVRIGEPPTEFDLEADSIRLDVTVFNVDSDDKATTVKQAFAGGHIVRVGDAFLVAYGPEGLVTTSGPVEDIDGQEAQVWVVTRA